jgi:hypothetical protein
MRGKKIMLLMALCGLMAYSCEQPKDRMVNVRGAITHLKGAELCVTYTNALYKLTIDTIQSSMSGRFHFKLQTCNDLAPITIYFSNKKCWTTLFAEPGDRITIRGNIESVDLLSIRGGIVNNDLNRFKTQIRDLYQERLDLLKGSYSRENTSEVRLAEINLLLKRAAKDFIMDNPTSIASVVLIQDFFYQDSDHYASDLLSLLRAPASTCHLADKIREGLRNK